MTSKAWYLLPLLFALPGGIIHYMAVKGNNPVQAKRGIYTGVGITVLWIANLLLGFSASL